MTVSTFVFLGLAFTKPRSQRIFHYITAGVTLVSAIAYFSMASNLGFTPIMVEFVRSNPRVSGTFREIFYVRYIDWYVGCRGSIESRMQIDPDPGSLQHRCCYLTFS